MRKSQKIKRVTRTLIILMSGLVMVTLMAACGSNSVVSDNNTGTGSGSGSGSKSSTGSDTLNPHIPEDYTSIASFSDHSQWGPYNVHDPSVIKVGKEYYMFSTDVAYGNNLDHVGIQIRKSKDLVHWQFVGWAFNGIPQKELTFMQQHQSGYKQKSIWAPFIMKVGNQFRLYYAVPGNNGLKLAAIGLATSNGILGPWKDNGIVISTTQSNPINAIDPTVIVDNNTGRYWMAYGSYYAGIYMVELDPSTGMLLHPGSTGHRIAFRQKAGQSIEGADILYNPDLKKYYLFVSYGWLEDTYNVRVGRADQPQGPYYDFNGNNMASVGDNLPRITAEYKFDNNAGWQGFGGNCTLRDGSNYYYISQARPSFNKYLMDLHVHKMVFTPGDWPVISSERYDEVPQETLTADSLDGTWEYIVLNKTQNHNVSQKIQLKSDGSISGRASNSTWTYNKGILTLKWNNGTETDVEKVFNGWDWENSRYTIVFTGLNNSGISVWGKKVK